MTRCPAAAARACARAARPCSATRRRARDAHGDLRRLAARLAAARSARRDLDVERDDPRRPRRPACGRTAVGVGGVGVGRRVGGGGGCTGQPSARRRGHASGSGRRAPRLPSPSTSSPRGVGSQASPTPVARRRRPDRRSATRRAVVVEVADAVAVGVRAAVDRAAPRSGHLSPDVVEAVVVGVAGHPRAAGPAEAERRRGREAARAPRSGGRRTRRRRPARGSWSTRVEQRVLERPRDRRQRIRLSQQRRGRRRPSASAIDVPLELRIGDRAAHGRADRHARARRGRPTPRRRCPSRPACPRWSVMPTQIRFGSVAAVACCTGRPGGSSLSLPSLPAATTNSVSGVVARRRSANASLIAALSAAGSQRVGRERRRRRSGSPRCAGVVERRQTTGELGRRRSCRASAAAGRGPAARRPTMPLPLSRCAAIMPATCVPWSAVPVGVAVVQPSAPTKSACRLDVAEQIGMVDVDDLVDDADRDARALGVLPRLGAVDVGVVAGSPAPTAAKTGRARGDVTATSGAA